LLGSQEAIKPEGLMERWVVGRRIPIARDSLDNIRKILGI
jgi:hypothetical protein